MSEASGLAKRFIRDPLPGPGIYPLAGGATGELAG